MDARPTCYGSIRLAAGSPCHHCRVAAMCARRFTRDNVFGVVVYPRVPAGVPQSAPGAPAAMPLDPDLGASVSAELERMGLHYVRSTRTWKYDRRPVCVVREANAARTVVELLDAPHPRVVEMPSARGVQVAPVYPKAAKSERVTPAAVRARRARSTGCIITAADWRAAVALVGEVVRSAQGEDDG